MTGNDIVDLNVAGLPRGERRFRFLRKIFTTREQESIGSGEVGIWSLWAMKEAIYKAHHRRFNLPRSFEPRKIEVVILEADDNYIKAGGEYNGYSYWGSGNLTSEYVHFTATCIPDKIIYREVHPSGQEIKTRLKHLISEKLNLDIKDLSFFKNDLLIPQLSYRSEDLNLPFSISHHGKYAAISLQLINY